LGSYLAPQVLLKTDAGMGDQDGLDGSEYLVGSHTIKVRPPILAKLNPNATHYCQMHPSDRLQVPLLIQGTPPFTLTYTRKHNHKESLKTTVVSEKVAHKLYYLTLNDPGIYTLESIQESSGDIGKILGSAAVVVSCPTATFDFSDSLFTPMKSGSSAIDDKTSFDACVDDVFPVGIRVTGTLPLSVFYQLQVDASSPILNKISSHSNDLTFNAESPAAQDLSVGSVKLVDHVSIESDVNYIFKIFRVVDGNNYYFDILHNIFSMLLYILLIPNGFNSHFRMDRFTLD
jgi:hypothetical protein